MHRFLKAAAVTGLFLLIFVPDCFAFRGALPADYPGYAAVLAHKGILFASSRGDSRLDVTVTCDLDLLEHLRTLEGYGLPTCRTISSNRLRMR